MESLFKKVARLFIIVIIHCFFYVSVFFRLGKKCKLQISENQVFCPKIVIFAFYGVKLWAKMGLVAL